ncbi:MAG: hypothetical protein CMF41_00335, partial [Legionellales bacterium]
MVTKNRGLGAELRNVDNVDLDDYADLVFVTLAINLGPDAFKSLKDSTNEQQSLFYKSLEGIVSNNESERLKGFSIVDYNAVSMSTTKSNFTWTDSHAKDSYVVQCEKKQMQEIHRMIRGKQIPISTESYNAWMESLAVGVNVEQKDKLKSLFEKSQIASNPALYTNIILNRGPDGKVDFELFSKGLKVVENNTMEVVALTNSQLFANDNVLPSKNLKKKMTKVLSNKFAIDPEQMSRWWDILKEKVNTQEWRGELKDSLKNVEKSSYSRVLLSVLMMFTVILSQGSQALGSLTKSAALCFGFGIILRMISAARPAELQAPRQDEYDRSKAVSNFGKDPQKERLKNFYNEMKAMDFDLKDILPDAQDSDSSISCMQDIVDNDPAMFRVLDTFYQTYCAMTDCQTSINDYLTENNELVDLVRIELPERNAAPSHVEKQQQRSMTTSDLGKSLSYKSNLQQLKIFHKSLKDDFLFVKNNSSQISKFNDF